ncbi:MAG TPA: acetylxylan esterase [Acidobacteriota bacterium]|nr:acetylxylan esterase [Acidobacteriota bacterium]
MKRIVLLPDQSFRKHIKAISHTLALALLSGLLLMSVASAQPNEAALRRMEDSQQQTTQALIEAAKKITASASEEILNQQAWEPLRKKRMEEMQDMLGLLPFPERTPLKVRITGTLDRGAYRVEKLVFESLPKIYVTANLYIPNRQEGPLPAVVYVCGHAPSPYGSKVKYQRHGISLAKNGYIAIILDPIQIAETFALHHGVASQEMYEWYSRGYTPAGPEVWNAMRAIDYLETRSEVDATRIGMTGRSGGAAMSWFTACVDPRVKVAIPVMGISTYAANLREDTQRHHCDCMFTINSYRHGMLHQGALIAPRPLLMVHGAKDVLFPVAGYEEFEQRIGDLYASYGHREHFRNIVVDTGHQDSDFLREAAIRWFDTFLMNTPGRELEMAYEDEPELNLAVFPDGPPEDAQNFRLHETFIPTPPFQTYASKVEWEKHRQELIDVLRNKVFGAFPLTQDLPEIRRETDPEGYFEELTFETEPGVRIRALLHEPPETQGLLPAALYVASDGEDPRSIQAMFHQVRSPDSVIRLVVYPRGIDEVGWNKAFWKSTQRNAMHVGQTVDSLRLWDVLQSVEVLRSFEKIDPDRITVLGTGVSGILGLYAAILDDGIDQVLLIRPPASHLEGPLFLNVLRYLDLAEAAALVAPRPLGFYGRLPAAFEPVRQVYKQLGQPQRPYVSMDIEAFVQGHYNHDFSSGR